MTEDLTPLAKEKGSDEEIDMVARIIMAACNDDKQLLARTIEQYKEYLANFNYNLNGLITRLEKTDE